MSMPLLRNVSESAASDRVKQQPDVHLDGAVPKDARAKPNARLGDESRVPR